MLIQPKIILKKLFPNKIFKHIKICRTLNQQERSIYVKWQLLRILGLRKDYQLRIPAKATRFILFVCHGNIIRSPMSAALLKKYIPEMYEDSITITSAGLYANRECNLDERALIVAREFGISLENHKPQPLSEELIYKTDIIFVMDFLNEARLLAQYPKARDKVFMLGAYFFKEKPFQIEIQDPYNGDFSDIRRCYKIIQSRIFELSRILFPLN